MRVLKIKGLWKVSIRYLIAEIHTEIACDDALEALRSALLLGLARHGFTDRATFDYVFSLMMEEQPERHWFEIARVQ